MVLKFLGESEVWRLVDNMEFFDMWTLEEIKPWPGFITSLYGTYGDEGGIIHNLRLIRDLLAKHEGNVEAATADVASYSFMESWEDLFLKRPMRVPYSDLREFEFWLKIYQRRGLSRGLVKWKQYNTRLPNLGYIYDKWMDDLGPKGGKATFAKYGVELLWASLECYNDPYWRYKNNKAHD